jgi:hypothetical protein
MRTFQVTNSLYERAIGYAARGWSVIPLRPRDKRPLLAWAAFQHLRASEEQIAAWYQQSPKANVGIVTGGISGLLVLDVDPKHGGDESLAVLQRQHGALPDGPVVITGGGGRHLYFAHPGMEVPNRASIMPGLDLRGDGGYVVAPPSVHPSGTPYCWLAGHEPDRVPVPVMPEWLRGLCGVDVRRQGHPVDYWRQLVRAGVAEGARNNTVASFTGHLLWHGVDREIILQLMLGWNRWRCRPPLADEEVVKIVRSIARIHARQAHDQHSDENAPG